MMTSALLKAMLQDWYLKTWKYQGRKLSVEDYARFVIEMIEYFLKNPMTASRNNEEGRKSASLEIIPSSRVIFKEHMTKQ
jgi:hypothetical protein